MSDIFVQDLRPNDAPSLNNLPRIETYEELQTWLNISVHSEFGWDVAPNGSLVWKLIGFYIQDGIASFIVNCQNESGSPVKDIGVVHSWPDAPNLPTTPTPNYGNEGIVGFTNIKGEAGFPYSGGMVYTGNKPYSGPGIIWPLCPQHLPEPKYADAVFGLGWVGGTDHTTINPVFRLVRKSTTPTGKFSLALFQDGVDLGIRLVFVEQHTGSGYELVLLNESGQILGSTQFK